MDDITQAPDGRRIRFVGTTRWSDFDLFGESQRAKSMRAASYYVKVMRATRRGQLFDPEAVRQEALLCRDWLAGHAPSPPRTYSLDLRRFESQFECNAQTPFTPPVPLIAALDRALEELAAAGGPAERQRTYSRRRNVLEAGLRRLGLSLLPLPAGSAAHSILTVEVPTHIGFDALYEGMKQRGYLIYACKAPLGPRYFQLAVMGELRDADLAGFLGTLGELLDESPARYHAAVG